MVDPNDAALANTAMHLNEDAKAARKRKTPAERAKEHLGTNDESADLKGALTELGKTIDETDADGEKYDLSEAAHDAKIKAMEDAASAAIITDKALIAFGRDLLMTQMRQMDRPWSKTSKGEQQDIAAACEHASRELVRKIVEELAAAGGRDPIRVLLTKVTLGDDIVIAGKVKTFAEDEEDRAVVALHAARGKHVMLTVASADDYAGGPEAQVDEDEPTLGFDSDPDE